MKKFLFSMICTLLPILASAQVQNEELTPYAVLSNDHTVLTFFYDNDKESKGGMGMDIGPFTSADERGWNEHCESIGHVIFDGSFANYTPTSTSYWFDGFTNLTQIDGLENLNTNNITDMSCMFNGCEKLGSLNLSGFYTPNVTYMSLMFGGCSSLEELDLSTFNTPNVQSMDGMFRGCSGLTSLDVSSFNTDNVTEMSEMFAGCSGLTSLDFGENFNTSNVTTMWAMFSGCSKLGNLDLSNFNTANVENMSAMFSDCSSLTNLDISNFNTENVISMANMFDGCSNLESLQMDFNNFSTESVTNMGSMFGGCLKLTTLDLSGFKTSNVSDFSHMFASCSGLTSLNVTGFDTSKAENMTSMFSGCSGLTSLDLSHFNTSKVTAMSSMFESCYNLESLNLSGLFNTSNATDLSYMFMECSSLTNLDLSSFKTSTVTEMQFMFSQCSGLETIYVGNEWSTENIESGGNMFTGCTALVGGEGTTYDANHVDYTYAHIDKATDPGYLAEKLDYNEGDFFTTETVEGVTMSFRVDDATQRICRVMAPEEDQRAIDTATTGTVTIPAKAHGYTVNRIHDYAFQDCAGVTEFVIPNSVESIEQCAFKRCTSLTTVHIPASVTSIDGLNGKPWVGCTSLTTITVDEENPNFDSRDNCNAIMETADDILYMGCKGTKIPETTKVIGHSSFDSMGELPALEIPASVTSIVAYAFWECSFPSVTSYIEEPFSTSSVWDHLPANCPLYVPEGKVEAYKAVDEWSKFTTIIEIGTEAYAALNEDNTKLTFYYDNKKEERGGMSVGPFTETSERGWDQQSGKIEQVEFDDSFADCTTITSTSYWFCGFTKLTTITDMDNLNTDNVSEMLNMFDGCSSLTILDVSNFNTSNVTDMNDMFNNCSSLTSLDVRNLNTSKVTNMFGMFKGCSGLTSLDVTGSEFDTSNVTDMSNMFEGCSSLTSLDVTGFDTSNVTDMEEMFDGCSSLTNLDLSSFNTSNVTEMQRMFYQCSGLETIYVGNEWSTESIESGDNMFTGCTALVGGAGTTYDENNVDYTYAHIDGGSLNRGYLSGAGQAAPYAVLSDNNTLLTFYYDDQKAIRGGMSVGPFTESSQKGWYYLSENIEQVIFDKSFANCTTITSTSYWFSGFTKLTAITGLENLKTDNVTNMAFMFYECYELTSLDLSGFNTSKVTDMGGMFFGCEKLTSLDLSGFNTSMVTIMANMFGGCSGLTSLDVSGFDTSKATNMAFMFSYCPGLTSLDLSGFNTANVTLMTHMFMDCTSLNTIYVGEGWSTENISSEDAGIGMFNGCTKLIGGAGTVFDNSHTDYTYAHIDKGEMNPGYLTGPSYEPYAVLSDNNTVLTFYYDNKKEARGGMSVGPFTSTDSREWKDDVTTITLVEFDPSFADCTNITSTARWFDGCSNLTEISGIKYLHTENVTSMRRMFNGCSGLEKLDVSGFNTESVTDMGSMFNGCSGLKTLNVTGFNTESVTDMSSMFNSCSGLSILDLSNFITVNAENMRNLFRGCSSLKTIYVGYEWITEPTMEGNNMFLNCTNLEGGAGTKYDANHTNQTYAHIDEGTSNPGYLTGPDQSRPYAVLSEDNNGLTLTFYYDNKKDERGGMDVGPFDDGGKKNGCGWSEVNEEITTVVFDDSFANCTTLTSTAYWFYGCENLTTIKNFSNLKTDNVIDINSMFHDCHSLKSIDFSSLNLSKVTNMHQVFEDCRTLESVNFSGVNTENVTDMSDLFLNCHNLKTIDISSFNTKNVTNMKSMFLRCDVLTTIYVGEEWTTENVTESESMFRESPNLVGGRGTTYDANHVDIEYAHIDGGSSNPGYLTDINAASEETWEKLQSRIEYGTDVLSKAKEISSVDQALIEKLDEALQSANQMYKIHEASEEEVLNMIEVLNERINDVEEDMNQPASEETWEELKATIEYGTDVLAKAKEISTIDQWLIEELDMTLDSGNQMYKIHEASEEEVLNMIDELNWRIKEVEEAMNQPASDEAWAELNKAVETGEKLQTEAKGVSTVEPWALEELENMTAKGSEMYKVHTAGEEEVRHMTEELNQIINEVEEMMRQQPQPQPQGEALFDGLTAWVSGSYTLDDAFEDIGGRSEAAKTIAAIVWNADGALTADMLSGIDNPNLLVYVTEASKAPSGVQNVIIDGVASEIVLTDATGNNNFYCPQSFTARSISYSHDFSQTTEIDVCRGWETIALPFDVQSITHESHGTLVPFGGSDNGYPFWLRQLSTNGLTRATKIEANHPYLLCMPNNIIYPPEYNQNGTVTFSSSNVTVPVTSARSVSGAGVTFHATFQQVTKSSSVYALNVGEARGDHPEGSVFEQNYRDIRPFQAYTTHSAGTRSFITLESLGGNDDATGIEELRIKNSEFGDAEGVWYSLDGRRLDAKPTKKGVYVKDGRKIVIK